MGLRQELFGEARIFFPPAKESQPLGVPQSSDSSLIGSECLIPRRSQATRCVSCQHCFPVHFQCNKGGLGTPRHSESVPRFSNTPRIWAEGCHRPKEPILGCDDSTCQINTDTCTPATMLLKRLKFRLYSTIRISGSLAVGVTLTNRHRVGAGSHPPC